jgi:hypothetical protein
MNTRLDDLGKFYEALSTLEMRIGGARRLNACHGRMDWPPRGVYFFFEPGELRRESGTGLRVVRVGTHALSEGSSSTLWGRLAQHRGSTTGGGNHRTSIFRLLVGEALAPRKGYGPSSWGVKGSLKEAAAALGRSASDLRDDEAALESEASRYVGEMPFVWINVDDRASPESPRGFIERNSIALLSNAAGDLLDGPSSSWLGLSSSREAVRSSGLWNNNHVRDGYDSTFIGRFVV